MNDILATNEPHQAWGFFVCKRDIHIGG